MSPSSGECRNGFSMMLSTYKTTKSLLNNTVFGVGGTNFVKQSTPADNNLGTRQGLVPQTYI